MVCAWLPPTENAGNEGAEREASGSHAEHKASGKDSVSHDIQLHHDQGFRAARSALEELEHVVDRVDILPQRDEQQQWWGFPDNRDYKFVRKTFLTKTWIPHF